MEFIHVSESNWTTSWLTSSLDIDNTEQTGKSEGPGVEQVIVGET